MAKQTATQGTAPTTQQGKAPPKGGNGKKGKEKPPVMVKEPVRATSDEVVHPHLKFVYHGTNIPADVLKAMEKVRNVPGMMFDVVPQPITAGKMKELLGWQSSKDYVEQQLSQMDNVPMESREKALAEANDLFEKEYDFVDLEGNKVRLLRNKSNRPIDIEHADKLGYTVLNRKWADSRNGNPSDSEDDVRTINGESIIVGRKGNTISAQHRGIGLVFAWQRWNGASDKLRRDAEHFKELWAEEPSIEGLIVYGVDESPETVRTLDNVKERTLSDVLYTDHELFGDVTDKQARKNLSKMLDYAISLLWLRTGVKDEKGSFTPYQTHSESIDFLNRHPRLKQCVKFIWENNQPKPIPGGKGRSVPPIGRFVPPGRAAAILYLMGSCATDEAVYTMGPGNDGKDARRETDSEGNFNVDWSYWERALEFFMAMTPAIDQLDDWIHAVYNVRRDTFPEEGDKGGFIMSPGPEGGNAKERTAVLVKAWNLFKDNEEESIKDDITSVLPNYRPVTDGGRRFMVLDDNPLCDGIDLNGEPVKKPKEKKGEKAATDGDTNPPTEEEVEAAKVQVKQEGLESTLDNADEAEGPIFSDESEVFGEDGSEAATESEEEPEPEDEPEPQPAKKIVRKR